MTDRTDALRVLFLCTENAARSQIAEALMSARRDTGLVAASAGTNPADRVHPLAIEELRNLGIDWSGAHPKSIDEVGLDGWDLVITVCDRARESCPTFGSRPVTAHWGIADPAAAEGEEAQRAAFSHAALMLGRRIDLMLALPLRNLERLGLEHRMREIGTAAGGPTPARP